MQKRTIILLAFLISFQLVASSQNIDSTIEIKLNLLRPEKGGNVVTVSVINHSNDNIYLPGFSLFASYSGIHYYEKQASGYREIDLGFEMYYDDHIKLEHDIQNSYNKKRSVITESASLSPIEKKRLLDSLSANTDSEGAGMMHYHQPSETYKQLSGKEGAIFRQQKAIAAAYCSQSDSIRREFATICNTKMDDGHDPVFLKAKDTLNFFGVVPIDYLFTKRADYKIAFNSEPMDTLSYNFKVMSVIQERYPTYPEDIMGYKRFHGTGVISNVIYFSTKDAALKK